MSGPQGPRCWGPTCLPECCCLSVCVVPASLLLAHTSLLSPPAGVRFPESCQEEVRDQKQLLKDAAAFLLSCQIPGLVRVGWGRGAPGAGAAGVTGSGASFASGSSWSLCRSDLRLLTCEADSSRSQQRASDTKGPRQASVVPWVPSLGGWQRGSGPPVSPCEGMADRAWEHLYPPPPPNKLGSESLCVSRGLAPRRGSPELRCCACPPISELSLPCPLLQGSRGKARDPAPSRAITGEPCCPLIAAPRWWSQQSQG